MAVIGCRSLVLVIIIIYKQYRLKFDFYIAYKPIAIDICFSKVNCEFKNANN